MSDRISIKENIIHDDNDGYGFGLKQLIKNDYFNTYKDSRNIKSNQKTYLKPQYAEI